MPTYNEVDPQHYGELQLVRSIESFNISELHLFPNLDNLPGVKDLDILIVSTESRLFCIAFEIKAISIDGLIRVGRSRSAWSIKDRSDSNPLMQALNAKNDLIKFFDGQKIAYPFITSSAIFPKITIADFRRKFSDGEDLGYINDVIRGCVFKDDLEKGKEFFINKLKDIYHNPPVRTGANETFLSKNSFNTFIQKFDNCLNKKYVPPSIIETEKIKLKKIEDAVKKEVLQDYYSGSLKSIIYEGLPGTGKTFKLLQYGAAFAKDEKSVLYICFNKTLRTDIKRFFEVAERVYPKSNYKTIDVFHIFELIRRSLSNVINLNHV